MGKSLPPWISVPESDAKGRNSTAVSNAQLTPTMGLCQQKGRGKGGNHNHLRVPGARAFAEPAQDPLRLGTRQQVPAG